MIASRLFGANDLGQWWFIVHFCKFTAQRIIFQLDIISNSSVFDKKFNTDLVPVLSCLCRAVGILST